MNERIRELAEQAWESITVQDALDHEALEKFDQKFAELIVRECVRYFNEDYQRNFSTLWREDLSKHIKEHFGVKE